MNIPTLGPLGFSHDYTHVKRPYRAYCVQYGSENQGDIIGLICECGGEATPYGAGLIVRWVGKQTPNIEMVYHGAWIRRGENGETKIMLNDVFMLKYEPV
jgi:hypothetical protein